MYQVIRTYGDNEPWWFFEDWQADIIQSVDFDSFDEASQYFAKQWLLLKNEKANMEGKPNFMTAFWNEQDERWCEECGDYLTQFTGLLLLKNQKPVSEECAREFYENHGHRANIKFCKLSLDRV